MTLVWNFKVDGMAETAEWEDGVMRCTVSEVYDLVDQLIVDGDKLPCGSATVMVEPTLFTEAGAYAVIAEALLEVADFQTIRPPQTDATIGNDVFYSDANDIEKASFGGDRSAAGRHAAQVRWGNRGKVELSEEEFVAQMQAEAQSIGDEMRILLGEDELGLMKEPTVGVFTSIDEIDNSHVIWENAVTKEFEPSPQLAELHDRTLALGFQITERANQKVGFQEGDSFSKNQELAKEETRLLGLIRPMGGEGITEFDALYGKDETYAKQFVSASQKFPTDWNADANTYYSNRAELSFNVSEGMGWEAGGAFGRSADDKKHRMSLWTADEDDGIGGEYRTLVHESTHMFDTVRPSSVTLSHAFLAYRTRTNSTGEKPSGEKLSTLVKTTKRKEWLDDSTENGHFRNPYSGRVYVDNGRRRRESSEVLTSITELILGGRGYMPDTEHRAFALGVLAAA